MISFADKPQARWLTAPRPVVLVIMNSSETDATNHSGYPRHVRTQGDVLWCE
jgi:hypothetical protein